MIDSEEKQKELIDARHKVGLYSIDELCQMFGCGRTKIDVALNTNQLKYMSPNGRIRFIYLDEFMEFMKKSN